MAKSGKKADHAAVAAKTATKTPTKTPTPDADGWVPQFHLDLMTSAPKGFLELVGQFHVWQKAQVLDDADKLADGWHLITQKMAERLLLRSPPNANRKAVLSGIVYYAMQMEANDWPKTGQPVIFDVFGNLVDGQHRLWACYLGGSPFWTYVVNQPEEIEYGFAYLDNGKARTSKDAFATAGRNGLSGVLSQVVSLAQSYDYGAFTVSQRHAVERWSPKQKLDYDAMHPSLREGCHQMASEHRSAAAIIGHADVAGFAAAKIIEYHDASVLDEFMYDLGAADDFEFPAGSPIEALRIVLKHDRNKKEQMKRHQILAHVIKAFNYWLADEPVKKLTVPVSESFPLFEKPKEPEPQLQDAAE